MEDSGYLEDEDFLKKKANLEDGEEIKWFTMTRSGYHVEIVGQVVKTALENCEPLETTEYEVSTALTWIIPRFTKRGFTVRRSTPLLRMR